jgi:hypothetical protein
VREFAEWLSKTDLSVAIHSSFGIIRLLQASHLLTAGVTCVSGLMIALRVLGWQRADQPFTVVCTRFAPWLSASFAIMLLTGIAQTLGDPVREFTSTSYFLKLSLVLICLIGTLLCVRTARRTPAAAEFPLAMKVMAMGLLFCWLAIPLLGRMIAYDRAIWGSLSLRP